MIKVIFLTALAVQGSTAQNFNGNNIKTNSLSSTKQDQAIASLVTEAVSNPLDSIVTSLQSKFDTHATRINSLSSSLSSSTYLSSESDTTVLHCCDSDSKFGDTNSIAKPNPYATDFLDTTKMCKRGRCSPEADNESKTTLSSSTTPSSTDCSKDIPTGQFLTQASQNRASDNGEALKLQYFASESGITTQFPAYQVNTTGKECTGHKEAQYIKNFDGRRRPWYLNAVHKEPLDIVVHMDYTDENTGRFPSHLQEVMVHDDWATDRLKTMEEAVLLMFDQLRPSDRLLLLDQSMRKMAEFHRYNIADFWANTRWPGYCPEYNQPITSPMTDSYPESCEHHQYFWNEVSQFSRCRAQWKFQWNTKRSKANAINHMAKEYRQGAIGDSNPSDINGIDYRTTAAQIETIFNISKRLDTLDTRLQNSPHARREKISMLIGYDDYNSEGTEVRYWPEANDKEGQMDSDGSSKYGKSAVGPPSLDMTMTLLTMVVELHPDVRRFAFGLDKEPEIMKRPSLHWTTMNTTGRDYDETRCPYVFVAEQPPEKGTAVPANQWACDNYTVGVTKTFRSVMQGSQSGGASVYAWGEKIRCDPACVLREQRNNLNFTKPSDYIGDGRYSRTETTEKNSPIHIAKELGRFIKYDELQDKVSEIRWGHPYQPDTGSGLVLTGSKAIYDSNTLLGVIGYDVDISAAFVDVVNLKTDDQYGFVLTYDGYVIYHPESNIDSVDYDPNYYTDFYGHITEIDAMINGNITEATVTYNDKTSKRSQSLNTKVATGTSYTIKCKKVTTPASYDSFIVCVSTKSSTKKTLKFSDASLAANVAGFSVTNENNCVHGPRIASKTMVSHYPPTAFKNKVTKAASLDSISNFIKSGVSTTDFVDGQKSKAIANVAHKFAAEWTAMDSAFLTQYPKEADFIKKIDFETKFPLPVWRYFGAIDGSFHVYPGTDAPVNFDATTRNWYRSAIDTDHVHISTPYKDSLGLGWVVTVSKRVKLPGTDGGYIGVLGTDYLLSQLKQTIEGTFEDCMAAQTTCIFVNNAGEILFWKDTLKGKSNLEISRTNEDGVTQNVPLPLYELILFNQNTIPNVHSVVEVMAPITEITTSQCFDTFSRESVGFLDFTGITSCKTSGKITVCPIAGTNIYKIAITLATGQTIMKFNSKDHIRAAGHIYPLRNNGTVYDACYGTTDKVLAKMVQCNPSDYHLDDTILGTYTATVDADGKRTGPGKYAKDTATVPTTPCIEGMPAGAFTRTLVFDDGLTNEETESGRLGIIIFAAIAIAVIIGGFIFAK